METLNLVYVPAIVIGFLVAGITWYFMPKRNLPFLANIALSVVGACLGAILIRIAQPDFHDALINLDIMAAIGGAIAAVLGGNFCYELVSTDDHHGRRRV